MSELPSQKPVELVYTEPDITAPQSTDVNVEQIFGMIPQVSVVPTWTPRLFKDGFAYYKSGATIRFYIYDFTNNAWHFAGLT